MPIKVFISHSAVDAGIAEALIKLFRRALNLPSSAIRCTSVDGYRLPAGSNTSDMLKAEVEESEILVGLITNFSIQSTYVLFELGARWGNGKPLMPILAAGATPKILKSPLSDYNALSCGNESHVYQIVSDISEKLGLEIERPNVYKDLVADVVTASNKRGEENKDFNIVIDSHIVGDAISDGWKKATMLCMTCSISNLSNRHLVVGYYDLQVKTSYGLLRLNPSYIPVDMKFNSEKQKIDIDNPSLHDLLKRTDSIAPGQLTLRATI